MFFDNFVDFQDARYTDMLWVYSVTMSDEKEGS